MYSTRLVPAEWHLLFPSAGKVSKRAVAASAASEVTTGAWPVQPVPAECEKKAEHNTLDSGPISIIPETNSPCRDIMREHP